MLPVGGIIVGVIGLLLGGYSAIKLSSVNRTLAEQKARVDTFESQVSTASESAAKASRDLATLTRSTQDAFNQVGPELASLRAAITKLEEAPKAAPKAGGGAPAVAGPDEYIVKSGDTGAKIARAKGVSLPDLLSVNPGVNWNRLDVGQKLKLPKK
ncbi:MAG: hypothetical protein RIS54_73 [Verrucomicrobiota bacterium]